MGAQQSSARDGAVPNHEASKTCYYELLGVELQATEDEIKRAYRKRALELHPDRNLGDVEASTRKFAEVQTAYEVLSDPQERAWYDSHRDAILRGQDQTGDGDEPATFRNVRLTSTEEILALMRKFNANVPFNDEPTGFFGITHETFEHLALEEEAAAEAENIDCPHYPGFGSSDDLYDSVVKSFYNAWAGFSTRKTFAWKDKYRLSDAPDRRVRRLMEKENKKCREDAIREFNDAVRFLVSFVRKRDPRYTPNTQTDTERQKSIRDAAAAQAARSRAAHQEKLASYEMPEWVQRKDDDPAAHQFSEPDEEEESEIEILECVICKKTFKSDKQLEAHERSKKHAKAIQQLRREMRKEGIELDLDSGSNSSTGPEPSSRKAGRLNRDVSTQEQADGDTMPVSLDTLVPESSKDVPSEFSSPRPEAQESSTGGSESELADTTDYASRQEVENRLALDRSIRRASSHAVTVGESEKDPLVTAMSDLLVDGHGSAPKIGKAKAKRERKAATTRLQDNEHQCSVCTETFASRTKLFNHIREQGHATAVPQTKLLGKQTKRR